MTPRFKTSKSILGFLTEHKYARLIQCEGVTLTSPDSFWVQLPTRERLKCDGRAARAAFRALKANNSDEAGRR